MKMRFRFGLILLLMAMTAFVAGYAPSAAGALAYPAWSPPLLLAGGGAEPSIRTPNSAQHGVAAYISAPTGLGSNFWVVHERPKANGTVVLDPTLPVQPDLGTGGGDSEISVSDAPDPATGCDIVAYSGLHNVDIFDNFTTASSSDCGENFSTPLLFGTQNTLTDRQWQTFDGAKTNFLMYHKVDTSQIVVSRSEDGGRTYVSLSPDGTQGIIDAQTFPKVFNTNQVGNVVTDRSQVIDGMTYPLSGDQVHALYATFVGPRDELDNVQAQAINTPASPPFNHNDTIYVAKSVDGGLTWTDKQVFTTDPVATPNRELNLLFPVVSVDKAGNVYIVWSDSYKIQYAVSRDHGATWSKAFQVNTDNRGLRPDKGRADVFPWIAAGGAGKIDVVWYHGEGGDTSQYRNAGDKNTKWTVAFAELFDADAPVGTMPVPKIAMRDDAITPVIHNGSVCNNGTLCIAPETPVTNQAGDRTLLDFFEVAIDTHGRANIAYATDASSPGSASVGYIRQNSGLSALDGKFVKPLALVLPAARKLLLGTSCPGPQIVDFVDDAPTALPADLGLGDVETLDILSVSFATPDPQNIKITLTLKNLSSIPSPGTAASLYEVVWEYNKVLHYVNVSTNGPGLQTYSTGRYDPGASLPDSRNKAEGTPSGAFNEGPKGTIVWIVPRSVIGNPPDGAVLTKQYAATHGSYRVAGSGVSWSADADRAPDFGAGSAYSVGAVCPQAAVLGKHTTRPALQGSHRSLPATGVEDSIMIAATMLASAFALGTRLRKRATSFPGI
ncbi:MAG: hypothetical protein ABR548_09090 [Actinomycetota bacterium]|nr:glycoside hydrolase [Actinomycetota bacterium]